MNNHLIAKILFAGALFIALSGKCQNERTVYTVTDSVRNGARWNYLRTIDLQTGNYSNIILRLLNANDTPVNGNPAMTNGVAAIAYDKKNKRLYYTPMLLDRLSYVDLRTMRTMVVTNNFTGLIPKATDQSNVITRIVIGDDEYGYALTNDGRHLIRFSTKNNPAVSDMGSLLDAPGNNEMSVHNSCSSFGGDLIADDNGHLYLITSRNHVFKIKISTRVATYKGTASGLPQNFTTSGVAVDNAVNRLVIVSSVDSSDFYTLNVHSLAARRSDALHPWLASDLGNGNILRTDNDDEDDDHHEDRMFPGLFVNYNNINNDSILLYPNPVTANEFKIQFINAIAGNYTVDLLDAKGQKIMTKNLTTSGKNNTVPVTLPGLTSKGIFIVRITDNNNRAVFSQKIIVQ